MASLPGAGDDMADQPQARPPSRAGRLVLTGVLALGLLARLALALVVGEARAAGSLESIQYLAMADSLASGGGLALPAALAAADAPAGEDLRRAPRMPGYPLVAAAVMMLAVEPVRPILVVQAVCSAAVMGLAAWMAWRLAGPWAGAVAAGLLAFDPYQVVLAGLVVPVVPLGLTVALAAAAGVAYLRAEDRGRRAWPWAALTGAAVAAGAYVSDAAAGLAAVAAVAALASRRRRRHLAAWAVGALVLACALAPWLIRNAVVLGRPVLTTDLGARLHAGAAAERAATVDATAGAGGSGAAVDQARGQAEANGAGEADAPAPAGPGEVEREAHLVRRALAEVAAAPLTWLGRVAGRAARTWSPEPLLADGRVEVPAAAGYTGLLPAAALAAVGAWVLVRRPGQTPGAGTTGPALVAWLLVPAAYVTLAHGLGLVAAWDRLAATPMLAVLGGVGLAAVLGGGNRAAPADGG